MNDEDIVKKKRFAEMFFQKRWPKLSDHGDDFGAYCVEKWLSGRAFGTPFYFLGVDYIRSHIHCQRDHGPDDFFLRKKRLFSEKAEAHFFSNQGSDSKDIHQFEEGYLLRDQRLSQRDRSILILYYEWGFNLKEIGDVIGVSESRIKQIMNQAIKKIGGDHAG